MKSITYILLVYAMLPNLANSTDWSQDAKLPGIQRCKVIHGAKRCYRDGNRANIFNSNQLKIETKKGSAHALQYPVDISGLQIPVGNIETYFNQSSNSPLKNFIFKVAKKFSHFNSFNDLYSWLGLTKVPQSKLEVGPNPITLDSQNPDLKTHLGVTVFKKNNERTLTFSCAACHSSDLFGTKVLGLTTRFSKANELFKIGKSAISKTPSIVYKHLFNANPAQMKIFKEAKNAVKYTEQKKPLALGLDTSLAQVGLSLAKRAPDAYASMKPIYSRFPRANKLNRVPADSKPAVWWNVKYKTRWLSDGSIVSGNPVHTNFLWNEIGRGTNLEDLEVWLKENVEKIKELTSFVFNTKAPRYEDFFPNEIDIQSAKRGEKLFLKTCSGCHGEYEKAWSDQSLSYNEQLKTTKIWYHETTPVIDIGTDKHRFEGMRYFYKDLNRLKISQTLKTTVKPSQGYVPPPLVGIWARWPYFHNNSAPTLYDVISPEFERPSSYIAVPSTDKKLDFDKKLNGYPRPHLIREPFKSDKDYFYSTKKKGLGNMGHTKMLVDSNGKEKMSESEKLDLIEFLKTL